MYYIILEITLGSDWSHISYSTAISQAKMIERKSNKQEGIHEENDEIKKTGDDKKMIVEEIMKSKKKWIKMEESKKKELTIIAKWLINDYE